MNRPDFSWMISYFFFPEQVVQGFVQGLADGNTQVDRRVVVTLFNRIDCLAGNLAQGGQLFLGEVFGCAGGFELQVFQSSSSSFLSRWRL